MITSVAIVSDEILIHLVNPESVVNWINKNWNLTNVSLLHNSVFYFRLIVVITSGLGRKIF